MTAPGVKRVPEGTSGRAPRPPGHTGPTGPPGAARSLDGLELSVDPSRATMSPEELEQTRLVLHEDVVSEYDARFYSAYVRELGLPLGCAFLELEASWAVDEARHYAGFRSVYVHLYGASELDAELAKRRPDFGPLEHLFEDEFSIACLGAYDELATVRAYRANLAVYDRLGPHFSDYIRGVIADEAWHYGRFLDLIAAEHRHRLGDAPRVVERIRSAEGTAYGNTFVLDHDDSVFTEAIFDEAAGILLRILERMARR